MSLPYWRLSGFYFFYFALLGAFIPYWSLFLQSQGYSALQIGLLASAVMGTRIIAPNLWGALADRSGRRLPVIRLGAFMAMLLFCGVFVSTRFSWMLLVVTLYSFFWNAVLAQFEVITLRHLGPAYNHYSRIRVWGSVGFIVTATLLGWVFEWIAVSYLPAFMLATLVGVWLFTLSVDAGPEQRAVTREWRLGQLLRQRAVLGFLLVCFLLQVAHGPYYTFFSLYLEELGYERRVIGLLWSLGVVAEVLVFMVMHRLLPYFGVRCIILVSLALAAVRWLLIGYGAHSLVLLILAQSLHAATFGAFHSAGIELVRRIFPGQLAGQGQALFSAVSFGAGGAAGALLAGLLWDADHAITFLGASLASVLALLVAVYSIKGEIIHERQH